MSCETHYQVIVKPQGGLSLRGGAHLYDVSSASRLQQLTCRLVGVVEYSSTRPPSTSNFQDPEKPQMQRRRHRFLAHKFTPQQADLSEQASQEIKFSFDFAVPQHVELDTEARRLLGIRRSRFASVYSLPPSFETSSNASLANSFGTVLKDLFLPWKGDKIAAVRYHIEIRVPRERGGAHRFAPASLQHKAKKFVVPVHLPSYRSDQLADNLNGTADLTREALPGYTRKERFGWSVDAEDPTGTRRFYKNGNLCLSMCQSVHLDDTVPFRITFDNPLAASTSVSIEAAILRSVSVRTDHGSTIIETGKVVGANPASITTHSHKYEDTPSTPSTPSQQPQPISRVDGCFQLNLADGLDGQSAFVPSFSFAALQVKYRLRLKVRLQDATQSFEASLVTPEILILDRRSSAVASSAGVITRQVSHAQLDQCSPSNSRPSTASGPVLYSTDMPPPYIDHLISSSVSVH